MSHARPVLALLAFLSAALMVPIGPAHAQVFGQVAAVTGWRFHSVLRVTDGTGPGEMVMIHKQDRHYGIFDINTGALKQDFPGYKEDFNQAFQTFDVDGDGRAELFFMRWQDLGPGSIRFAQYRWNGSSYALVFDLPQKVEGFLTAPLRTQAFQDLIDAGSNDVTVRDKNTGQAIWRASTSIPGWIGTNPNFLFVDLEGDGILEFMITETDSRVPSTLSVIHMIKYSGGPGGTFNRIWSAPGRVFEEILNADIDPEPEFVLQDVTSLSGHKTLVEGLTGITALDLPQLGLFHQVFARDLQGDGPQEIIGSRQQPDDLQVYGFGPGGYRQLFATTASHEAFYVASLRSLTRPDFVLRTLTDVRILDSDGQLVFTASSGVPGWTGVGSDVAFSDVDHDGFLEMLLQEGGKLHSIRYNGAFTQSWQADSATFYRSIGNTDGDPQDELMITRGATGHFRLVDGLTGATETDWLGSHSNDTFVEAATFLPGGPAHLLFSRSPFGGTPPFFTAYLWDGAGYPARYAIPDSAGYGRIQARSSTENELFEAVYSADPGPVRTTDILVRDALDGHLMFQASGTLANWSGLDMDDPTPQDVIVIHERDTRRIVLSEPWGTRFLQIFPSLGAPPAAAPAALRVLPNSPNPFRTSTDLSFDLPRAQRATVRIYDAMGRLVRYFDRPFAAGRNTLRWDGLDDGGRPAPRGVLFYEVQASGMRQSRKLVRIE